MPTVRGSIRLLSLLTRAVQGDVLATRRLAWRFLAGNAEQIAFERDGIRWAGPLSNVVVEELFIYGHYQQGQIRPLSKWLEKRSPSWASSSIIINVGANIGDSAIVLTLETGKRVLACEPIPVAFHFLEENVRLNSLEGRVIYRPVAIGARSGLIEMVSPRDTAQAEVATRGEQGFGPLTGPAGVRTQATMTTLAALLRTEGIEVPEVGLVWSDTQGYESEVVAGGPVLWKAGVPLWVELWPHGLDAHGGTSRFIALCHEHFRSFVNASAFNAVEPEVRDVSQLACFSEQVRREPKPFQDILLLP
jgi:FkbM family methyltransferase